MIPSMYTQLVAKFTFCDNDGNERDAVVEFGYYPGTDYHINSASEQPNDEPDIDGMIITVDGVDMSNDVDMMQIAECHAMSMAKDLLEKLVADRF